MLHICKFCLLSSLGARRDPSVVSSFSRVFVKNFIFCIVTSLVSIPSKSRSSLDTRDPNRTEGRSRSCVSVLWWLSFEMWSVVREEYLSSRCIFPMILEEGGNSRCWLLFLSSQGTVRLGVGVDETGVYGSITVNGLGQSRVWDGSRWSTGFKRPLPPPSPTHSLVRLEINVNSDPYKEQRINRRLDEKVDVPSRVPELL